MSISIFLLINQYIPILRHSQSSRYQSTYLSLPPSIHIFVVGPQSLINNLTELGVPSSAINLISPNKLSSTPNGSITIIDWNYANKTLHMNYNELARTLETPMGKNDLVIIVNENPSETLMLEETMAVAWGQPIPQQGHWVPGLLN
ncbi:hypothetical protein [Vulcanisaeta sp. JCM 16159]|uniref:hypothetical protein n=1 Tax=Vulcanisaeta sp. JCM 16159 TaxID=1295371 RepID=UPI0006D1A5C5|nr:hypothetical protein [Vulcanisaeta sp. JCM 16159]